jgi:phosphate transport system permease protein
MAALARNGLTHAPDDDKPRPIVARVSTGDLIFRSAMRAAGLLVLVITASILIFLVARSIPAFKSAGFGFFTTSQFNGYQFGIAAILPFSVLIAVIALVIAIPVGIATALFISEYAPPGLRRALIAAIDLMAAVPSIVVAVFGLYFLMPRILGFDSWLAQHLGFIPVFRVTGPNSPVTYVQSTFIAGVVVSLLVIPIITSLSRQVFSQAPQGEREAAYALGATRWGMIRTVVLPFGRAGMIGASMLGLGRALGETIAVSFILTPIYSFTPHVLQSGGNSVTYMIANYLLDAGSLERSALLAAAMVLFVMTLGINVLAAIVINRSRSGATAAAD